MTWDGKTIGIALSGGGFRASLFGLGSLWRLNEIGLLRRLDRITSVSGGSILSGVLAKNWQLLSFKDGVAANFAEQVAEPVKAFCSKTIDISAGIWGALTPFRSAGDFLVDRYEEELFGKTTLKELAPPATNETPVFLFYATSLQTGRSFRFRQDYIADYLLGQSTSTVVSLARAVAASSAFPPVFSPIVIKSDPAAWTNSLTTVPDLQALQSRIVLADGGVYDNMGLEALVDRMDISLVSDAGAPFKIDVSPPEDVAFQLGRVRDILIDQTRALRKRWLIEEYKAGRKRGAYWGIGTRIGDYALTDALTKDSATTEALEGIPTRLGSFSKDRQGQLINWGYALADVALRKRAGIAGGPKASWPEAEHAV